MSESPHKYRLSKSKIAAFEHCPRRLWLQVHRRHVGKYDAATLARFQFGHDVGHRATLAVRDGVMVTLLPDIQAALDRTRELLEAMPPRPIFEATFLHKNVLVCVDILQPDGEGGWQAIEVKASNRVKAYQLADIATQIWVMRGCGVHVSKATIRHLASPVNWRRPNIEAVQFKDADVAHSIRRFIATRARIAAEASLVAKGVEVHRDVGDHCHRPFTCEFRCHCAAAQALPLLATIDSN